MANHCGGDIDILLGIPRDSRWDLARYEQPREGGWFYAATATPAGT